MTDYYGETGFNAQDTKPSGIQGCDADEFARLADLERRQAEAGYDLWGGPLPSPAHHAVTAADRALSRAEHERAPAEVLIPLVDALSDAVGEYRAQLRAAAVLAAAGREQS